MFDIVLVISPLVLLATFFVGAVLIVKGHDLKDRKKRCICGYSLHGLPLSVECCPECGATREEIKRELHRCGSRRIILGLICVSIAVLLGLSCVSIALLFAMPLIIMGLFS